MLGNRERANEEENTGRTGVVIFSFVFVAPKRFPTAMMRILHTLCSLKTSITGKKSPVMSAPSFLITGDHLFSHSARRRPRVTLYM